METTDLEQAPDASVAQFIGGPADGLVCTFPGREPADELCLHLRSDLRTVPPSLLAQAVYQRRVNMDPAGPRWLYDYVGTVPR